MSTLKQDARILTENYNLERKGEKMSHKEMDDYLSRINDVLEKRPELLKHIFSKKLIPEKTFLGNEELIRQIAYKELQREQKNNFDMGYGMREITNEDIHNKMRTISEELQDSIDPWFDYIFSEDAYQYSLSAKYWIKEGLFAFDGRSENTIKPFPKLNQQALAKVIDIFEAKNFGKQLENNISLEEDEWNKILNKKILKNKDFTTLYTAALKSLPESKENNLYITQGEWKKYPRDYEGENGIAQQLVKDIEDYHTGWCTAGFETALNQLKDGDFYVYYSYNQEGKAVIPRIAIRMEGYEIKEIRGINHGQEMDEYMSQTNILEDKLQEEFGESAYEKYKQKIHDTKKLTKLFNESFDKVLKEGGNEDDVNDYDYIWKNPNLTKEDIDFLLGDIQIFGYEPDIRIDQVIYGIVENIQYFSFTYKEFYLKLIKNGYGDYVAENFEKLYGIPEEKHKEIVLLLIENGYGDYVAENFEKFYGIQSEDHEEIASKILGLGLVGLEYHLKQNFYKFHGIQESFEEFYEKHKKQNS